MNSYFTPKVLDAIRETLMSEENAKSSINQQVRDAIRKAIAQEYSSGCSDDETDSEAGEDQ